MTKPRPHRSPTCQGPPGRKTSFLHVPATTRQARATNPLRRTTVMSRFWSRRKISDVRAASIHHARLGSRVYRMKSLWGSSASCQSHHFPDALNPAKSFEESLMMKLSGKEWILVSHFYYVFFSLFSPSKVGPWKIVIQLNTYWIT